MPQSSKPEIALLVRVLISIDISANERDDLRQLYTAAQGVPITHRIESDI
jgi:hypothetical protein